MARFLFNATEIFELLLQLITKIAIICFLYAHISSHYSSKRFPDFAIGMQMFILCLNGFATNCLPKKEKKNTQPSSIIRLMYAAYCTTGSVINHLMALICFGICMSFSLQPLCIHSCTATHTPVFVYPLYKLNVYLLNYIRHSRK